MDWHFQEKHSHYARLGDVYLVVTPGVLTVEVADAQVAADISKATGTFTKPAWLFGSWPADNIAPLLLLLLAPVF